MGAYRCLWQISDNNIYYIKNCKHYKDHILNIWSISILRGYASESSKLRSRGPGTTNKLLFDCAKATSPSVSISPPKKTATPKDPSDQPSFVPSPLCAVLPPGVPAAQVALEGGDPSLTSMKLFNGVRETTPTRSVFFVRFQHLIIFKNVVKYPYHSWDMLVFRY